MRQTFRLLASVKPARYLEPGMPTGLTGLRTYPNPRSSLLYLYNSTLEKLQAAPESSLYRQSVEAVTKHRLSLVQATVPEGHAEWQSKVSKILEENKDKFKEGNGIARIEGGRGHIVMKGGEAFIVRQLPFSMDIRKRKAQWDGEINDGGELEGHRSEAERAEQALLKERREKGDGDITGWIDEPQLTVDQISELENKIGAGLIEEVIQVAEGELKLVDVMVKSQAWEGLEEKPAEGQWTYFDRKE